MKRIIRLAAILLAIAMLAGITACGTSGDGPNADPSGNDAEKVTLKISFFKGGFGEEWLQAMTEAYTAEHPNVTFQLEGDPDMTLKIGTRLESGANLPDIAMILSTSWQQWAAKNYLEDLSDVYKEDLGDGVTMYEKLVDATADVGLYAGKYWMVPWSDALNGIVYNAGMFRENGWTEPKTVAELYDLMGKIKEKGIAPFAFGGKVITYWDFPVLAWWSQYEGTDGMATFLKLDSPDVYGQQGRLEALRVFEKIIMDKTNYIDGAMGMDHMQSQMAFLQGKAAMMPNGAWVENEMRNSLPEGFEMSIMLTPAIDGAKTQDVSVSTGQDMIFIPKKAKNKEVAKDFLKFMASDEMLNLFTQKTGTPRPFEYRPDTENLSDFSQKVISLWKSANKVYMFSNNPIYFMKYGYWPALGAPYARIQIGDETADECFSTDYSFARSKWEATKAELGME